MSGGIGSFLSGGLLGGLLGKSGGQQQTSTQTTDLPEWMKPYAQSYLKQASDFSQTPYQAYGGQTVASLNPYTQQGTDLQAQMGTQGTAAGNAGQAGLQDVLGGKYLNANSNPYLQGQIDAAQQDVVRNYNTAVKPATESAMVGSGSFGNSGLLQMQGQQQSDLQRNLGQISTQMRGNAYNTERGNQMQALGMSPTFNSMAFGNTQQLQQAGQTQQQQQQNELSDAYQKWLQAQQDPYQKLGVMGSALGSMRGGTTTQTQPGASPLSQVAGLAAMAAPFFMPSDRRLKTDIKRVGKTDDGLNVYTYRYKDGGPVQMGVMAQEVEKVKPEAVARRSDGMRAVNYGLLGG